LTTFGELDSLSELFTSGSSSEELLSLEELDESLPFFPLPSL